MVVTVAVMASTFAFAFTVATPNTASAAVANAPTITSMTPGNGTLQVGFNAPSGATGITNYEYSIDGGLSWTPASPATTSSPITISGLSNCSTYPVTLRAINADGAGLPAETWNGIPSQYTYSLDNGNMRFGSGSEASILSSGNLKAPTYYSAGNWWPMTYGNSALNYALGVGGDGTNEWNTNGTIQEFSGVTLSRQTIDCSAFVVTGVSGSVATGYGTLSTTGRYTFSTGQQIEITRRYTQTATSKYTVFNESIKNVGTSSISNARLWVGTQDDYIGSSDANTKKRGNINSSGIFTKITAATQQAKVLEISNGTDTVYFYTTSNLGNVTGLQRYGNFTTQVVNQNPSTAAIEVTNDGSYGLFLRFQDLAPDATESFSWYYVASSSGTAQSVLAGVASAALPQAPTVNSVTSGNSSATVNFTAGDAGGAPITNYQYSVNGGTTWITRSPASTSSPLVITGLQNGTTYDVQIRAVNSEGSGSATSTSQVTPQGPPAAPTITSVAQTANSLTVDFDAPTSNGGSVVTNYEYTTDGGTTWITPSPAITTSPLTISGLSSGTDYSLAIRAVNAIGSGTATATRAVSTYDVPEAPTISSVTARDSSLSVAITFGSNGGTPLTNLEYSTDNGATWTARNPASTFSPLLITGLQNGTTYDVKVRAENAVGVSADSLAVQGTPAAVPGVPVLSGSVTASSQSITVTITPPTDGGSPITGYEYSTDRGTTWRTRSDSGGTSTSLQIDYLSTDGTTRLTNGVEYCVQVRAVNAIGSGLASADLCTTPKSVPDAPTVTNAISRDRAIDIEFTLGSNGGDPITSLEYCISTCVSAADWITATSFQSPLRIDGLTNGTNYTVTLRVSNSLGTSANSATQNASTVPANSPSEPTITSVTTSSQTSTVAFTTPASDGGSAITNYEYSLDGGSTWTARSPISTSSPLVISGLTNGTTYGISLRAITAVTTGLASSTTYATPLSIPSAPTSVVTTGLNQRISVTFTAPDSGGSPITTYQYALSTDNGGSYGSWISTNSTTTSFTINGLTNGTGYRLLLRAVNSVGDGTSSAAQAANTTPTGVPESPSITSTANSDSLVSLTGSQIAVYFTEPANNGSAITNYQYSTDDGATWRNRTDSTGRFSPVVISKLSSDGTTTLARGTSYPVRIRAVNANGSGDPSALTSITTGGDITPPTVTVTRAATSTTRVFTYTFTFSETVSGFSTADFVQTGGTATCSTTSVSAASGTSLTATVTCSNDGTVVMNLLADSVTDAGGNTGPLAAVVASQVQVDGTVPQATFVVSSTSSARTFTYQVDFSETVSGMTTSDFTQTGGTATCSTTAVSTSSGTSFVFTVVCSDDGTVEMSLAANAVTDGINTAPLANSAAPSVEVDTVLPTVTITPSTTMSPSRVVTYTFTFSEPVSGFNTAAFVQTGGTASCTTTSVSASTGTILTAEVTCIDDGTVEMELATNVVSDIAGNTGPTVAVSTSSVRVDATAPSLTYVGGSTSTARSFTYQIDFDEYVSDVSIADFVQTDGTATCATTAVSGSSGTSFVFTVDCSDDGTVEMSLVANAVTDGINTAPASIAPLTTVLVDTVFPTVLVSPPGTTSASRVFTYTFSFSEDVFGFDISDFVQDSGTASCTTTAVSAASGTNLTAEVTCTNDGTVVMKLLANAITDVGGNGGPTSSLTTTSVQVDGSIPQAIFIVPASSSSRTLTYQLEFTEFVTDITVADLVQTSGTASCSTTSVTAVSGGSYLFTVVCSSDGSVVMSLVANAATDGVNTAPASAQDAPSIAIDSQIPTVLITEPATPSSSSTFVYIIDFSEPINGFTLGDFVQTSGTASCLTTAISSFSGTSITATVTCATEGTFAMSLRANAVSDGINAAPAADIASGTKKFDNTPPSASVISTQVDPAQRLVSYLIQFSEPVTGLTTSDFRQTGGTASCQIASVTQSNSTDYVVTVQCANDGTVEISLAANAVSDGLFNGPQLAMTTNSTTVLAPAIIPVPLPTDPGTPPAQEPTTETTIMPTSTREPVMIDGSLPEVVTNIPVVLVNGVEVQVKVEVVPDVGIRITLPSGVALSFSVTDSSGNTMPPSPDGIIEVVRGARIQLAGEGVMPGSEVVVWLFSEPKLLGTVLADADGKFVADFPIGDDVEIGQHTAQINATGFDGAPLSVNSAVQVGEMSSSSSSSGTWIVALGLFMGAVAVMAGLWLFLTTRRSRRDQKAEV